MASLQRVKRREKIVLVLAVLVALAFYRSQPVASLDQQTADSILGLQPFGVDGRTVPVFVLRGLYELSRQVSTASLTYVVAYFAAVFAAFTLITLYFVYRELFGQRYIGIVTLLLVGLAPAFVLAASGAHMVVIALFFIAVSVYAWLRQRWILWGIATGLALSSHYGSTALALPFLGWMIWSRKSMERPWRIAVGTFVAAVIALSSYYWVLSAQGGLEPWVEERLTEALRGVPLALAGSPVVGVEHVIFSVVYVALALAFAGFFRKNSFALQVVVSVFVVALPCTFLLYVSGPSLFGASGVLLWAMALVSLLPLWISDPNRREIAFVLCWFVPLLIVAAILAPALNGLFVFALFPLALLACRFLDRTLDGAWLDFWWAAGLPTAWYYRLSKLVVLLVLALSYLQAIRLRD